MAFVLVIVKREKKKNEIHFRGRQEVAVRHSKEGNNRQREREAAQRGEEAEERRGRSRYELTFRSPGRVGGGRV